MATTSTTLDTTRDRIVSAATDEFAEYGVAGARIERIARRAQTSKERLYAYFRSKQELYRFVAERELATMTRAAALDATDLPGYAGQLHDYFTEHPQRLRLMHWGRLDVTGDGVSGELFQGVVRRDVEELRRAQAAGQLDPAWDPIDILVLVNEIAIAWAWQPNLAGLAGLGPGHVRDASPAARRAAIVAAVARLFPATHGASTGDGAADSVNPGGTQRGDCSCGNG
ncbi:TetR family transcriptional regulator [Nocardia sp. NPDC058379]|uniref:TetR family transcriptional regulator n=1 Tax=unclassified Nocardia TaxID=2637762 RepID=UPI0036582B14